MTTTPPTMRDITRAVCERLTRAGVAYWPGEDGAYTLTPGSNVTVARVQVRVRAPYDADPLADAALAALHGAHHETWGGLRVARCAHLSALQLGADQSGLDERSDNYELHITN